MCIRVIRWVFITGWIAFGIAGCGDHNNFFGSLADDNSIEAKIEEAQIALDNGDCQKAINGFTSAFNDDTNNVGIRVNLAAAYTCRAGFSVPELIRIVADFAASNQTADQFNLLKAIADATVDLVSARWNADTATAIGFLTDANPPVPGGCDPRPFSDHPDAAFNEAIVATVRAVMAVTELENAAGGVILTGTIPPATATLVGRALRDADNGIACAKTIGDSAIVATDVAQAISELNLGANNLDGDMTNDLTADELVEFLDDQGFSIN